LRGELDHTIAKSRRDASAALSVPGRLPATPDLSLWSSHRAGGRFSSSSLFGTRSLWRAGQGRPTMPRLPGGHRARQRGGGGVASNGGPSYSGLPLRPSYLAAFECAGTPRPECHSTQHLPRGYRLQPRCDSRRSQPACRAREGRRRAGSRMPTATRTATRSR
jgi:hypothetical protein